MKRLTGFLLALVLVFSFSAALAQKVDCPVGGFSVNLPDHFREMEWDPLLDPELCFNWAGKKLTVQAYVSYQGEVAGSDLFEVLTGNETEYGPVTVNGMYMLYTRIEEFGQVRISYTWMDRGNSVSMEFTYSEDEPSVENTVNSIINSITFDAGH